ncbi:hypothetical protein GCM10010358_27010 [Streptomyces minutiscleroticus]|uniref:Uncharacterized protein n=1 Tax=Streptomyces minutiscleroticus TaxID=68238 RepID=A0A918KPJ9_9ACTN|nr:hypothetical protein GCM10010358_27010 [Streptomyces minutiscleroticus]
MCMAQQTLSSTSWMVRRALAGLLADGCHRPCSAFPGPWTQWLPARAGAGLPDHSGEGRTGITPDFPFTKAW